MASDFPDAGDVDVSGGRVVGWEGVGYYRSRHVHDVGRDVIGAEEAEDARAAAGAFDHFGEFAGGGVAAAGVFAEGGHARE